MLQLYSLRAYVFYFLCSTDDCKQKLTRRKIASNFEQLYKTTIAVALGVRGRGTAPHTESEISHYFRAKCLELEEQTWRNWRKELNRQISTLHLVLNTVNVQNEVHQQNIGKHRTLGFKNFWTVRVQSRPVLDTTNKATVLKSPVLSATSLEPAVVD